MSPRTAERWALIPGVPGYEVSDQGRVLSRRPWRGSLEPRILRVAHNVKSGYPMVSLPSESGFAKRNVHALVMLAFVGQPPPGKEIRHLDGDPRNCALANLAYGTHAENVADTLAHGNHPMASRDRCRHDHEFTPENTRIWHSAGRPYRQCITCANARRTKGVAA